MRRYYILFFIKWFSFITNANNSEISALRIGIKDYTPTFSVYALSAFSFFPLREEIPFPRVSETSSCNLETYTVLCYFNCDKNKFQKRCLVSIIIMICSHYIFTQNKFTAHEFNINPYVKFGLSITNTIFYFFNTIFNFP